jgi:hypothetical protein
MSLGYGVRFRVMDLPLAALPPFRGLDLRLGRVCGTLLGGLGFSLTFVPPWATFIAVARGREGE